MEIRIESMNKDNSHSWVRIYHGSNKFVMNLNNNETEIPEDQLEEYALKLDAKDFASRSKAKTKPQRIEPAGSSPRIVPIERRNLVMNGSQRCELHNLAYFWWVGWELFSVQSLAVAILVKSYSAQNFQRTNGIKFAAL